MSTPGLVVAVIPARLAATRLPQKPLLPIDGRPLLLHVIERVRAAALVSEVLVATPDPEIAAVARGAGAAVWLGGSDARTGSDRVAMAAGGRLDDAALWLNVQGDQPRLDPAALDALIAEMGRTPAADLGTLRAPLEGPPDDPARVKVVCDPRHRALWFSRQPVPTGGPWWLHLGVYAFRPATLRRFAALPTSPHERSESLEQLRILEDGASIYAFPWPRAWSAVDVPADLQPGSRAGG